jgi:transposase-like protein
VACSYNGREKCGSTTQPIRYNDKRRILEEAGQSGASVAEVARR